jgi:NADP-dependent 3-hydroxy acid dehydrogenase YdfG
MKPLRSFVPNRRPEVVVVTGASAGVGRATVRAFAQRGAHVGLIARNREALEAARREVEASGGKALICVADVADAQAVDAAADAIESELGPIDVWVNNAMVTVMSPIRALAPDEIKRVTEVTYLGTVYGTLAALKHMRKRNRGVVVQVGSALAYRAIPLQAPYCGAKFAIRGFTDSLRSELAHEKSKVHVTMVQMPALNTPQFDWCRTHLAHEPQPVPPIFCARGGGACDRLGRVSPAPRIECRLAVAARNLGTEADTGRARPLSRRHRLSVSADRSTGRSESRRQPLAYSARRSRCDWPIQRVHP